MKTVDAVDHHIRFKAMWDDYERHVFIPLEYIESDAGRTLSRAEAIDYVRAHLDTYRREPQAVTPREDMDLNKIVTIVRDQQQA